MAGVSIVAEINDAELRTALAALAGASRKMLAPIGMALVKGTQRRFRAGRDPDGAAWAPLHPKYKPIKRGPSILIASGLLMRSISYRVGASDVRVGTNRIYARVHQFGAVIQAKRAPYLRFRMANGIWLKKSVFIPPRPYLGIDREDEQEIGDVLAAVLGFR